jgi:hypothetical protein
MSLTHKITDKSAYERLAVDCSELIDEQVSTKTGLSGMALKTAYKVVTKGLGNDYIPAAISRLLPETLTALNPMWVEGVEQGDPVAYLTQNSDRTADIILSATDERITKNGGGIVGASYKQLRKSIKRDVVEAVPSLAKIIDKHAS